MKLSRRTFLRAGSVTSLAVLFSGRFSPMAFAQQAAGPKLGSGVGTPIPKEVFSDTLYKITRMMFTENLGTRFTFRLGGVKLTDMPLIAVYNLNPPFVKSDGTTSRECFSIVFQGPASIPLRQGTYTVAHSTLGTFDLFIVPGARNGTALHYEAVINRVSP